MPSRLACGLARRLFHVLLLRLASRCFAARWAWSPRLACREWLGRLAWAAAVSGVLFAMLSVRLATAVGADPSPKPVSKPLFEDHILPILKARCFRCHAGAEPASGLRVTSRAELLAGGESGPAIRLGAAESSLIWVKIASGEMPQGGPPLSAGEKGLLRVWINEGAPTSAPVTTAGTGTPQAGQAGTPQAGTPQDGTPAAGSRPASAVMPMPTHWSFLPPVRPAIPDSRVRDTVSTTTVNSNGPSPMKAGPEATESPRTAVDAFILETLREKGLAGAGPAGRAILLRRVTFALLGLPPRVEDIADFSADETPDAWERQLDRLLANPQYGERWGRHWLDLAGYADSAGILNEDKPIANAYRYRDYVIRSLNADKAYDRFLQEQLAGDELSDYWTVYETQERLPEAVVEAVTATGYLRCAADASRPDFASIKNADAQYFYPTINDTLQIIASSTMGLTLQCARCHSHKYDPIPQTDYYRMQAVLMTAFRPKQWIPQMDRKLPVATRAEQKSAEAANTQLDKRIASIRQELVQLKATYAERLFENRLAQVSEPIRADVKTSFTKSAKDRSPIEAYLADKFQAALRPDDKTLDKLLPETFADYKQAVDKQGQAIAAAERERIRFDELRALYDLPGDVVTPVLRRGDPLTPGDPVEPGVLSAVAAPEPFQWPRASTAISGDSAAGDGATRSGPAVSHATSTATPNQEKTSGRRLAFARWLTQPRHPLTARVLVNRVWLQHFGEGLVATPEDFGVLGSAPSHPRLLDWLACEFADSGWSLKSLHRVLLSSAVYRQSSTVSAAAEDAGRAVDPGNRLLWKQRLRRLEAEPLRDAMLAAAGTLDHSLYGPPIPVARRGDGEVNVADGANARRRSIYLQVLRLAPVTLLQSHDQPIMAVNCTRRGQSTVATQALTLLNSDSVAAAARDLAERACAANVGDGSVESAIRYLGLSAWSRDFTAEETAELKQFLARQAAAYAATGSQPAGSTAGPTAEQERKAWHDLAHMLLAANEFVYID